MTTPPLHKSAPSDTNKPEPSSRGGGLFWLGLVLVWVFAAGFLQFARLPQLAVPAAERVNDGAEPTFFALHINPYYVFSEDFHLYVVRSKRILDRGWTDALLWSREDARPNYSAPLQAALMMLALQTDGRPGPYSLFIFGVLGVSWSILYVAAARWLPPTVSPLTVPIAVLVTVLFESIGGLVERSTEFGQWPVHRGLRMATLAWSNPLALALVIALVSLLFVRHRPWGRIVFAGLVLVILALADTWAFLLGGAATAVVLAAALGLYLSSRRKQLHQEARSLLLTLLALSLAAATALALNRATSPRLEGEVLTRTGFGEAWKESPYGAIEARKYIRRARTQALFGIVLGVALSTYATLRFSRRPLALDCDLQFDKPTSARLHWASLIVVPMAATSLLIAVLAEFGIEEYHTAQFVWRMDFMLLFAATAIASEVIKTALRHVIRRPIVQMRWELAASLALLAILGYYHNLRIHRFAVRTAAREFYLTRDLEALRDWIRERDKDFSEYSLVTASHELNHLCAYWTHADLMLPEGFPHFTLEPTTEIENRMARLLAVYRATPEGWREFNLHRHVWDQWSWAISRLDSARYGYMYYLLHRTVGVEGNAPEPVVHRPNGSRTLHLAESRLNRDRNRRMGFFYDHSAEIKSMERIADLLDRVSQLSSEERPDVILIDEVSRSLGTPDLEGYVREFRHGDIEAWVRVADESNHLARSAPAEGAQHVSRQ